MKRVIIANDHGAVDIKKRLAAHLESRGFTVENLGVDSEDSVDYPDKAREACTRFLADGEYEFGIRCALPQNIYAAQMAREHNDANFIAFGGRIEYWEPAEQMLDAFIDASFGGDRHGRRVDKIMGLEGC